MRALCIATIFTLAIFSSIATETELVSELPSKIIAGEIHYSRVPVEYWEHRLLTIKSMGFNALSVYIMWNYHEISRGKFDY
jgi:beta-galactosidase